jgi:hypothetical protein
VTANVLVPFGKYKGQPVEVMRADRSYCDWAMAQPGMRERYSSLFTVIVNGGVSPDAPTPEHNRMQLLFRDPDMRLAVFRAIAGAEAFDRGIDRQAAESAQRDVEAQAIAAGDAAALAGLDEETAASRFQPKTPIERSEFSLRVGGDSLWRWPSKLDDVFGRSWGWETAWGCGYASDYSSSWTDERKAEQRARMEAAEAHRDAAKRRIGFAAQQAATAELKRLTTNSEDRRLTVKAKLRILETIRQTKVEFEVQGWDVYFPDRGLALELKPQVGDDYPAILRAMKLRNERWERRVTERSALIVDQFEAESTSLDDLKWLFAQSGMRVRTLAEVRDCIIYRGEEVL